MIAIARETLRTRPRLFVGTFVAVALGVTLICATGLVIASGARERGTSRFGQDTVVVTADGRLEVPRPGARGGVAPKPYVHTFEPTPPLAADEINRFALPGVADVIADRSLSAQLLGSDGRPVRTRGTETRAHGWASASFGPYPLAQGRAPQAPDEIVIDGRLAHAGGLAPGDDVRVLLVTEVVAVRIVGVTAPATTSEAAIFLTDTRARDLAPQPDAIDAAVLVVEDGADVDAVAATAATVAGDVHVLTGDDRREAEPDPIGVAVAEMGGLLGLMAGTSGFVSIFIVANTFAFAIIQRRRELALLRLVGATSRQVRRMLLTEALLVTLIAIAIGWALSMPAAVMLVTFLRWLAVAPPQFEVQLHPLPLLVASVAMLAAALAGVWIAARRARGIRPVEALREAVVEQRSTIGRQIAGGACLAGGIAMLLAIPRAGGDAGLAIALFVGQVLVVGAALLGPALVPTLVRWIAIPLARLGDATVEVARDSARTQIRRTVSVAAPILIMVGIAGSLLTTTSALARASASSLHRQVAADLVVVPTAGEPGVPHELVRQIRVVDGVDTVTAPAEMPVYVPTRARLEMMTGAGIDAPSLADPGAGLHYESEAGKLGDLTGQTVAINDTQAELLDWRLGDTVKVWLSDGTPAELEVIASFHGGLSAPDVLLPDEIVEAHAPDASPAAAYVTMREDAPASAVGNAVDRALRGTGMVALSRDAFLARAASGQQQGMRTGLVAMLGVAIVYTAIAIVNTLVMAIRERTRDLAQLRLAGGTPRQALHAALWESAMVSSIGVLLGLVVTAITAVALPEALRQAGSPAPPTFPLVALTGLVVTTTVLALVTSAAAAVAAVRVRPIDGIGVQD